MIAILTVVEVTVNSNRVAMDNNKVADTASSSLSRATVSSKEEEEDMASNKAEEATANSKVASSREVMVNNKVAEEVMASSKVEGEEAMASNNKVDTAVTISTSMFIFIQFTSQTNSESPYLH